MYHQGEIDLNGTYSIDSVPTGPVKIAVASPKPDDPSGRGAGKGGRGPAGAAAGGGVGKANPDMEDPREKFFAAQGGKKNEPERPKPAPGQWFAIPDKYADPTTSGLSGDVKSGTPLDIDIK
jgi:hypothetical protein